MSIIITETPLNLQCFIWYSMFALRFVPLRWAVACWLARPAIPASYCNCWHFRLRSAVCASVTAPLSPRHALITLRLCVDNYCLQRQLQILLTAILCPLWARPISGQKTIGWESPRSLMNKQNHGVNFRVKKYSVGNSFSNNLVPIWKFYLGVHLRFQKLD